ncbi:hypothetical protein LPJ66_010942 [Kickxella alabastrina]|uniref:Uncharacterized protein n=1 Tax=Kickxella alabastrina TaxID=61397 RepID=A0ACC1HZ50_9FUNG|nr:hypothetical protein LPJ66_010942 [Kickxella alabastrina]
MMEIVDSPSAHASSNCTSAEQTSALKQINALLEMPSICLSRIREPLALVGGYWNIDADIINKVSTGTPHTAEEGIVDMCAVFSNIRHSPSLDAKIKRDIAIFVERAGAWVANNRI